MPRNEAEVTAVRQQGITVAWTEYGSYAWLTWTDLEGFQLEKP